MRIADVAADWEGGATFPQLAEKYGVSRETLRKLVRDHLGEERYSAVKSARMSAKLPPTRQKFFAGQFDPAPVAVEWLAGATLQALCKKHGVPNPQKLGWILRAHLGDSAYERECRRRKSKAGRACFGLPPITKGEEVHSIFTRAWA